MIIKNRRYQPSPNIAEELKKFPDNNLSQKQVQQFIGIVNYLRDFVPKIAKLTNSMRKMLKKDPPPWRSKQTRAIRQLKEKTAQLPPLQIPSKEKRILQTDASDKYWGAILFEEDNGKRRLCGYKSRRFSDAEIHYHSTFKEILAVKYGITKFQFHLTGYYFLVEMDMSSFPKMLQFKQKEVPHPQLLRWAEWFSRFSFDVIHIKGKDNVLADILTRLPKKSTHVPIPKPIEVFMFQPTSSKNKGKQKQNQPPSPFSIPCNANTHPDHPLEVLSLILEKKFHKEAMNMTLSYQLDVFRNFGGLFLKPLGLHPNYPFINPIKFQFGEFPEELKWMLCPFDLKDLQKYLCQINRFIPSEIWPSGNSQAPWDVQKNPPTPYQQKLKQALEEYRTNIPDPKEWSQDYPMHCSQMIQETPVWKDIHETGGSRQNPKADKDVIPDDLEKKD
ncbi:hypothetical protein Goari_027399 [Gossypium aridum]|uniref:Reverse transcriptase RNase H-like domain-containing protein n=1 Tax=Gossypium aridum TaxID=34290 RepID=A0A7J8YRS0_GOSAI|nr:hypothetical protein [Gossypium aridum]